MLKIHVGIYWYTAKIAVYLQKLQSVASLGKKYLCHGGLCPVYKHLQQPQNIVYVQWVQRELHDHLSYINLKTKSNKQQKK